MRSIPLWPRWRRRGRACTAICGSSSAGATAGFGWFGISTWTGSGGSSTASSMYDRQGTPLRRLQVHLAGCDAGVEALADAVGVHLAHRDHLALVGKTEDAGGETRLADLGLELRGVHEVVAREGEAAQAHTSTQGVDEQPAERGPRLGPEPSGGPASHPPEEPARVGADEPQGAGHRFQRQVVAEGHAAQAAGEELGHHGHVLGLVANELV